MNVPIEIIGIFVTAWLGIQGWTIITITRLMSKVARLEQQLEDCRTACKTVKIAKKLEEML